MSHVSSLPAKAAAVPIPHERLRELDFFLGTWRALGFCHETLFAPRKPLEMLIEGSREETGFWITRRYVECLTPDNPEPVTAFSIWGYDAASDDFLSDWFDSKGGRARHRSKGWTGDRFEFVGTITMHGSTFPQRDTFIRQGPDAYYHIAELDLGSGWIAVDEEDAVRQASLAWCRPRSEINYLAGTRRP